MRRHPTLLLILALGLSACHQPPPSPPVMAPAPASPVFQPGGSLRGGEISVEHPMPPSGFGLYLYVLPEREVSVAMQTALMKFHECLNRPGPTDRPRRVALMIMPVRHTSSGDRIDIALAHDYLRTLPVQESRTHNQVWFVASNTPLRPDAPTPDATPIPLGRIAPALVSDWLFRFQDNIEQGSVAAPSDWLPRIESAGLILVTVAHTFVGVPSAQAAANACAGDS